MFTVWISDKSEEREQQNYELIAHWIMRFPRKKKSKRAQHEIIINY